MEIALNHNVPYETFPIHAGNEYTRSLDSFKDKAVSSE